MRNTGIKVPEEDSNTVSRHCVEDCRKGGGGWQVPGEDCMTVSWQCDWNGEKVPEEDSVTVDGHCGR